jgi:hypothetical protein
MPAIMDMSIPFLFMDVRRSDPVTRRAFGLEKSEEKVRSVLSKSARTLLK